MHETRFPAPGSRPPAVLLVDDDELVRESLAGLLEELPVGVIEASGGREALELLRRHPEIAVLITDMMMPGMDGRTLAEAARALRPGIHVLYLSGLLRPPIGESFLPKPVAGETLLAAVKQMVPPSAG